MRRLSILFLAAVLSLSTPTYAQSARQVLDKTAAAVSAKSGAQASFTTTGELLNTSGTIAIKGKKFRLISTVGKSWFDGKTQWTYMKKNDEVYVSTPTEEEQAANNPYRFINLYKNGYTYTMIKKGGNYEVHLKAQSKTQAISEMYIVVNQKTYIPSQIRGKGTGWWKIDLKDFKKANLSDNLFRFNPKDCPTAEIIDIRK